MEGRYDKASNIYILATLLLSQRPLVNTNSIEPDCWKMKVAPPLLKE